MLHGGAHRVLDGSAVEAADGLKLVERDDNRAIAGLGEPRGQGEHFLREPGDIAFRADIGKRDCEKGSSPFFRKW